LSDVGKNLKTEKELLKELLAKFQFPIKLKIVDPFDFRVIFELKHCCTLKKLCQGSIYGKIRKMAIRRTREDKINARHQFLYSWSDKATESQFEHNVKRQLKTELGVDSKDSETSKNVNILAQNGTLASIKRDLLKSLFLACLILGIEVVLYLAWL